MNDQSKNLKGALFSKNEATVIGKGKIMINGEERYAAMIKSKLPSGEEINELVFSAGRIYTNEKTKETQPDLGGNVYFNGIKYRFSGWQNVSQNGSDYVNVELTNNEQNAPF